MIQLTTAMVRALAGAPMTVLVLLMIERNPVTQAYIRRHTGFSDHTVQDAIELLADYGMISETGRYTWQIAAGVQQLPLGFEALPETPAGGPSAPVAEEKVIDAPPVAGPAEPEADKISLPDGPQDETLPGELADEKIRSQNLRANSSSLVLESRSSRPEERPGLGLGPGLESGGSQKTRFEENLAECDARGIEEPARSRISRKEHVTPEYIQYIFGISNNRRHAVARMLKDWDSWSWKTKAGNLSENAAEREIDALEPDQEARAPIDDHASAWWARLVELLREKIPRADFACYVPADAPARRIGDGLFVLAGNHQVSKVIRQYLTADDLGKIASQVSGGVVTGLQFVTSYPDQGARP